MTTLKALRNVAVAVCAVASLFAILASSASAAASPGNYSCEETGSLELAGGNENEACGYDALHFDSLGGGNIATGSEALYTNISGSLNIATGSEALLSNTGSFNLALGYDAGKLLTYGSQNVDIDNEGVTNESNTTRIGSEGKQTKTFVSGIYPTELTGCFVQVTSAGQLGCNKNAAAEGKEGKPGPEGKEGKEGKAPPSKGLKICVPEKAGGNIKLPPCKKGFRETEVTEL
jgi:hypothetical protein